MTRPLYRPVLVAVAALAAAGVAWACFGNRLRIGVPDGRAGALAAYALGYYLEERAGVEPEFVAVAGDPVAPFQAHAVDLVVVPRDRAAPDGAVVRDAGAVPGLGPARFWVRPEVPEDLRFSLVERALGRIPALYASGPYREAEAGGGEPRPAARQAVLRAD